jgi:hypothetical protein
MTANSENVLHHKKPGGHTSLGSTTQMFIHPSYVTAAHS